MGNSSSWGVLNRSSHSKHLAKSKLEDYENIPDLHRIINPKGGGELVDLAWSAHQMKSYNKIDDFIRQEVSKYLLNDGKGEMIPIEEIVFHRNKESKRKSPDDKPLKMPLKIDKDEKSEYKARLVCFDMNKRGKAGETLLHLCFSNGTYLHMLIARRLIQIFPNMINDICVGDELYGQTALHMAVVNEDPYMLNFLLSWGADVNQRACGRFFIPDDQKDRRQNLDKYEYPTLPTNTNYDCLSYFGEYPLSFAAILNQEDCVRLLVAYGAGMDKQDSNGNTALHMCVINNNVEIFKLLVEHQANLEIKNNQGFTPLTLAAELCREEIFFFILETQREIYWVYANISCAAYPLTNVDTISETGSIDTKSVLHLILNKNTEEHLELLEGFLTDLLHKKWYTFVRFRFFVEAFVYMLFFILNAVTLFLKRIYYDHLGDINCTEITLEENHLTEECECAYRDPNDDLKYPRTILELIVLFYTCVLILIHLNEIYIQRWQFLQTLLPNPTRFLYLLALILILIIVPLRFSCNTYGEDVLVVLIIIFISINTMYYARGFKFITTFVYKFHLILRNNMPRFFLIYFIFLLGFSQTFYLIFTANPPDQEAHVFNSVINSFLHTIVLTVNEVFVEYNRFDYVSSYVIIGGIFIVIYLMIGGLLMINILIAMMDHTQEMTNERTNEWVRQWGKQVLFVEQNVNIKERLKQQKRYAHQMNNGVKALVVRWKQSETERKEAMHNKEMFRENVKNVQAAHKNE